MKEQKRAQMEILGLAIVVVLVIMATLFVVKFVSMKSPVNYRKGFVSSEIASNIINTFLKTASEGCSQLTMTELLQDCAQGQAIRCDDGEYSCSFVNSTAIQIFGDTLDKWSMKYEFLAYKSINSPLIMLGNACLKEKISKEFPIPISSDKMYVKMDVCG